jgi:hypothetical protein
MTFDTRPSGAADLAPPALRVAIGERAGADCLTPSTFAANLGNPGGYGISDRAWRDITAWAVQTDALITHQPDASYFST